MKTLQELRAELKIVREYHYTLRSAGKGVKIFVSDDVKRLIEKCPLVLENAPRPV